MNMCAYSFDSHLVLRSQCKTSINQTSGLKYSKRPSSVLIVLNAKWETNKYQSLEWLDCNPQTCDLLQSRQSTRKNNVTHDPYWNITHFSRYTNSLLHWFPKISLVPKQHRAITNLDRNRQYWLMSEMEKIQMKVAMSIWSRAKTFFF